MNSDSILLDQFVRVMKIAPHTMVISCISKDVYIFTHKPTEVSFYVAGEVDDEGAHCFNVSFFQGGQTIPLSKIGQNDPTYEALSIHLSLYNLNDLLEAQFKMDAYLERVDSLK